jgi:4-carboxymuconolactone decarboxylase
MSKPKTKPPKPYQRFKETYPAVGAAYEKLGDACHNAGPLDHKTRELVKLGIAIGANLESGTHAHTRLALEAGATPDELRHAAVLATTTIGFPSMMRALCWVNETIEKQRAK